MRSACNFIANLVRANGRFIFVNTNTHFDEIISEMSKAIGVKKDNSWRLGGFLTNSFSPKRFRGRNKKLVLGAIRAPDCVVIFDTERKSSVIAEASKLNVPIIGLVDSSMPVEIYNKITYPIPANASAQFVYLFCNLITKTILAEKKALEMERSRKAGIREDAVPTNVSQTLTKDEVFVLPYESLAAISEDVSDMKNLLEKVVVVKYNAELGVDMGFNGPKSVIEVSNGLTCIDLFINQLEFLNSKYGCNIPLLIINTENTHGPTAKVLEKHANKNVHALIQGPNLEEDDTHLQPELSSVDEDKSQEKKFSEILLSLKRSGQLDVLLSQGKEYIVMLSSDNQGHVVDEKILSHMIKHKLDQCCEVMPVSSDLEESERLPKEGKIELRKKLKFINTMWVSMGSVRMLLQTQRSIQILSTKYAINIPKSNYLPVEETSDLLLLQSDIYILADGILSRNPARENPANPSIELGPEFQNVSDFQRRFKSIPSIIGLESLIVSGDVWFGDGVTLKGNVRIGARTGLKIVIPDGAVLENEIISRQADIEVSS